MSQSNSRRNFLKSTSLGATGLVLGSSLPGLGMANSQKPLTIGIIGSENSHTAGFGKMFNIDKKFPGVTVKYVWGETDEFAKKAMEKGQIPNQVQDPKAMLGKIDALIVDHRHPKYHLKAAEPFVKAGIPTFIDKPFCYRAEKGKMFLEMARRVGTPVTSYSSIAQSDATFDMKDQLASMDKIIQVVRTGKVDLDSKYGGVFFYGVHLVQPLMYIFGEDIERVKITRNGSQGNAMVQFTSGLYANLVFKYKAYEWQTYVETTDDFVELKSRVEETNPAKNYVDMVEMFRTGKEPRSHQSILNCVSVLEAMEKSAVSEKWVDVKFLKLD
jgi:predicted dehydrogenase